MQLDQNVFSVAFDAMVVSFKQEANDFIKGAYYKGALESGFDDRTWEIACEGAIKQDKFFPKMDRLVELALGDRLHDLAKEDWRWAYYLMSGGEAWHGLSDVGRMALESLGRLQDLGMLDDEYNKSVTKEKFFRAHRAYALKQGLSVVNSPTATPIEGDERREGMRRLFNGH